MWWIPLIMAGASLAGAYIQSRGAKSAAQTQAGAADAATQLQWQMYQQTRSDLAPWRYAGRNALTYLDAFMRPGVSINGRPIMDYFTESPSYQFRLGEGIKAMERGAAARGMLQSGAEKKALMSYGQDLASQEFQNYLNNWWKMAGFGENANAQTTAAGTATGQGMAQTTQNAGQAVAAGQLGQANIWGNYLTQLGKMGGQYGMMNYGGYGMNNPYMNQMIANRNALNYQTGGQYAYGM